MNFSEAINNLKCGLKVTRAPWEGAIYFALENSVVLTYQSSTSYYGFDESIMISEGWVVDGCEEQEHDFPSAINLLMSGSKARLKEWKDCYIYFSSKENMLMLRSMTAFPYTPIVLDFLASDWMVV